MQNVFLIGMPSSGKSTIGRKLATLLGYAFVDLDQMIVEDQKMSIPEIFKSFGEDYFRQVESGLLKAIAPDSRLLVATGGGAPCFFDNMDFILNTGLSVFIEVSAAELASRIRAHAVDDRPLLSGLSDLERELQLKLDYRLQYYSRAHLTITPDVNPEALVVRLQPLLNSDK